MRLKTPSAPFSPVCVVGESITVDTAGKVLVLPSGNPDILPAHNEYVLSSRRLSLEDYPWGGVSDFPDFLPGTLYTATDGIYLTDIAGNNSTKTLTAGKLKELNLLTVDTVAHTITEEFIVANTATSNNPTVIDNCDSTTNWSIGSGTGGTIESVDGVIHISSTATGSGLRGRLQRNISLSGYNFICFSIKSSITANLSCAITTGAPYVGWTDTRIQLPANTWVNVVLPFRAPVGSTGSNPTTVSGTPDFTAVTNIYIGALISNGVAGEIWIDNITADTAKSAYIELQTPNNLAPSSLTIQTHNGIAYQTCRVSSLDGAWSDISSTPANVTMADGTQFDHVYGAGLGRAVFPKGIAEATVNGSTGTMTYSANKGTSKRIGFRVDLPPSDGGRTNFNKIRLKTILTYAPDAEDNYSASYDFADSTNTSYGLQNLSKPWIALYDPTSNLIDFYLFTYRPKNLEFKRDESGTIYEVRLYPGNGLIYYGQIHYSDLSNDSDSNDIPDCLEAAVDGSVTKFLANYSMVV